MLVPLTILLLSNYILAYDGEPRKYYNLQEAEDYFSWFVETYNKTYTKNEAKMRFQIFVNNLKTVNENNAGLKSPVFGITQFSDLTVQEFLRKHTCLKLSSDFPTYCDKKTEVNITYGDIPEQFDWRDKNVVTSVKNQKDCGSCWAFGATGTVEGAYALKSGKPVDLSPQQLIDCDKESQGCGGGLASLAFQSLIKLGGQEKESDYIYTATDDGVCKFDRSKVVVKLKSCSAYKISEEQAKGLLVKNGPISIAVDASSFGSYSSGVLRNCLNGRLNHAVLLVGYGKDENGIDYWTIKNSWGTIWGEEGYGRIERGVNACGLTDYYFEVVEIAE